MEGFVIVGSGLPEWLRTFFVDDRGEVYLPCAAFGNEQMATLCLVYDGVPVVQDAGHVYAPSWWLIKEHPQSADAIRVMATKGREGSICRAVAVP